MFQSCREQLACQGDVGRGVVAAHDNALQALLLQAGVSSLSAEAHSRHEAALNAVLWRHAPCSVQ